jgi:hypothetical protein
MYSVSNRIVLEYEYPRGNPFIPNASWSVMSSPSQYVEDTIVRFTAAVMKPYGRKPLALIQRPVCFGLKLTRWRWGEMTFLLLLQVPKAPYACAHEGVHVIKELWRLDGLLGEGQRRSDRTSPTLIGQRSG